MAFSWKSGKFHRKAELTQRGENFLIRSLYLLRRTVGCVMFSCVLFIRSEPFKC